MSTKNPEEYLTLPYTIEIVHDKGENYSGWFARILEWPGCMTQADTFDELGEMIRDAMLAWVRTALEEGQDIPEPRSSEEFSGKFVVRVPKSLHRELVEAANRDGVSLNTWIISVLSKTIGSGKLPNVVKRSNDQTSPKPTHRQIIPYRVSLQKYMPGSTRERKQRYKTGKKHF